MLRTLTQQYVLSGVQGNGTTIPFNVTISESSLAVEIDSTLSSGLELMNSQKGLKHWTCVLLTENLYPIVWLKIMNCREDGSLLVTAQVSDSLKTSEKTYFEWIVSLCSTVPINSSEQLELELYPGMP